MKERLDNFYLSQPEPQQNTLLALRDIILKYSDKLSETEKYGMPCFLYQKNIFCYLWVDKKTAEPYIIMTEGNYLENPELEKGNRTRMKILRIAPDKDIPIDVIHAIFDDAVELYKKGIVKLKK